MQQYSQEQKCWIWLSSLTESSPKNFYNILKVFGSAEDFFGAVVSSSELLCEVPDKLLSSAKAYASKQYLAEMLCLLNEKGINVLTRLDDEYPKLLCSIKSPPPVLFFKGNMTGLGEMISIVGTRRPTRQAKSLTEKIACELGEAGITVVSGMAYGIDTCAHKGALKADAKTVAVLGCGVDVIYPKENEKLYEQILNSGAVVSELFAGTQPLPTYFPARNRIVTGLSKGTLIVESETKGGTAISAKMAVSQYRDVFAVPGISSMSELPNALIKQGAVPVTSAQDILEFYGLNAKNNVTSDEQSQIQLDFLQRHIYNLLLKGDLNVENIAELAQHPLSEVSAALTMMELGGIVKRLPGGRYGV